MNAIPPVNRPRYSTRPLPPYSYVSGFAPHPLSDPRGHMQGRAAPFSPDQAWISPDQAWSGLLVDSEEYRYGVDLFNHGYYWEAHEAWESLWHAAGRKGALAAWLKALIKLAAAAVKLREGNSRGVERHAQRAQELLNQLTAANSPDQAWSGLWLGIAIEDVRNVASDLIAQAQAGLKSSAPAHVLDQWLPLEI